MRKININSRADLDSLLENRKNKSIQKKKCGNARCPGMFYKKRGKWGKCSICKGSGVWQ